MNYVGDYTAGDTVMIYFNTFDSNDPSASVTMTNFINTDVHIHKNDDLTQRNNAAGITVDVDVDGIAGCHLIKIDTADNTVANFYVPGADYGVRIEGVTVDAATLNPFVGHFSLENRHVAGSMVKTTIATLASQTSFTLTAGSADNDAYNNCTAIITDIASGVQKCVGRISDYTGATKTVTLAADPGVFTMAAADRIHIFATSALANVHSVGGTTQTANDDGADINAILADTNELQGDWTNAGRLDAIIDAILEDTDLIDDGTSGLAKIATDVAAVLVDTSTTIDNLVDDLEARLGTPSDFGSGTSTIAANLQDLADNGTAVFDRATDSLQALRDHIDDGTNLTEAGGTGDQLTAVPWNAAWDAQVESEVTDALVAHNLDHIALTATAGADMTTEVADNTILSRVLANGDTSAFVPSTDGLQPIRDHVGDGTNLTEAGGDGDHLTAAGITAAAVNAEVVDALATDTYAEPAQGTPAATASLSAKIGYLYKNWRNKKTQDAATWELYNDDAATVDHKAAVSDDGTDATKGEIATGP